MKIRAILTVAVAACLVPLFGAAPATRPTHEAPDQPAPRLDHGKLETHFAELHKKFMEARSPKTQLLLLGASIMERWRIAGKEAYASHLGKYDPDDFGVSGDKTQHVLWRIEQGELDGMDPRVVAIHIGNNNLDSDSVEDIVRGVTAVVHAIETKLPHTRVLVMAFFPRGVDPENPAVTRLRKKITQVNEQLAKLDDGNRTRVLDIGAKFLDADGIIRYSMMNDAEHPTGKGYEIWGTAMQPLLDEMMAAPPLTSPPGAAAK